MSVDWSSVSVFIQARMGSNRLPGKTLKDLCGKPILQHMLEGLTSIIPAKSICVLTSTGPEDDAIDAFLNTQGISCFRGHPANVASRFLHASKQAGTDHFVRLSGDSPFLDPRIVEMAVELYDQRKIMVSTAGPLPFPSGMNVEVLPKKFFHDTYPMFYRAQHFEHVTAFFYEGTGTDTMVFLPCRVSRASEIKFSVDTQQDFDRIEMLCKHFTKPHYQYSFEEKCALYSRFILEKA